jgi:elongation factor Ts
MSFSIIDAQTYNQGKIGAIVEICIECDEISLNNVEKDDLHAFLKEILFHIAAVAPLYLSVSDVPDNIIQDIRDEAAANLRNNYFSNNNHTDRAGLHIQKQIIKGVKYLLDKFYEENCLFSQPFIKDKTKTIQSLLDEKSRALKKVIAVKRFERYQLEKKNKYNPILRR